MVCRFPQQRCTVLVRSLLLVRARSCHDSAAISRCYSMATVDVMQARLHTEALCRNRIQWAEVGIGAVRGGQAQVTGAHASRKHGTGGELFAEAFCLICAPSQSLRALSPPSFPLCRTPSLARSHARSRHGLDCSGAFGIRLLRLAGPLVCAHPSDLISEDNFLSRARQTSWDGHLPWLHAREARQRNNLPYMFCHAKGCCVLRMTSLRQCFSSDPRCQSTNDASPYWQPVPTDLIVEFVFPPCIEASQSRAELDRRTARSPARVHGATR